MLEKVLFLLYIYLHDLGFKLTSLIISDASQQTFSARM